MGLWVKQIWTKSLHEVTIPNKDKEIKRRSKQKNQKQKPRDTGKGQIKNKLKKNSKVSI